MRRVIPHGLISNKVCKSLVEIRKNIFLNKALLTISYLGFKAKDATGIVLVRDYICIFTFHRTPDNIHIQQLLLIQTHRTGHRCCYSPRSVSLCQCTSLQFFRLDHFHSLFFYQEVRHNLISGLWVQLGERCLVVKGLKGFINCHLSSFIKDPFYLPRNKLIPDPLLSSKILKILWLLSCPQSLSCYHHYDTSSAGTHSQYSSCALLPLAIVLINPLQSIGQSSFAVVPSIELTIKAVERTSPTRI